MRRYTLLTFKVVLNDTKNYLMVEEEAVSISLWIVFEFFLASAMHWCSLSGLIAEPPGLWTWQSSFSVVADLHSTTVTHASEDSSS